MEIEGVWCLQCQSTPRFQVVSLSIEENDQTNVGTIEFEVVCPICSCRFIVQRDIVQWGELRGIHKDTEISFSGKLKDAKDNMNKYNFE